MDQDLDLPVRKAPGVHRGGDGELLLGAQAPETLRVDTAFEERAIPEGMAAWSQQDLSRCTKQSYVTHTHTTYHVSIFICHTSKVTQNHALIM